MEAQLLVIDGPVVQIEVHASEMRSATYAAAQNSSTSSMNSTV